VGEWHLSVVIVVIIHSTNIMSFCCVEYWLQYYTDQSYVLILDFRDTFFQGSPFSHLPPFEQRVPKYQLDVFAENWKVCGAVSLMSHMIMIASVGRSWCDLFVFASDANRLRPLVTANTTPCGWHAASARPPSRQSRSRP
jgi:hypothetical protein